MNSVANSRRRSQVRIPDDWDGESFTVAMLCVPDSPIWRATVMGAISALSLGRYWDASTGTVTDAQAIGWEIAEGLSMDCNEVFEDIRDAIRELNVNAGCCPSTATDEPPANPPPSDILLDGIGTPPAGWGSWEDVNDFKCIYAQDFHAKLVQAIQEVEDYGGLGVGIGGAALAAIFALISLPWTIAVGLVATVVALLTDFQLKQVRLDVQSMQFDFVCAIHVSETVVSAKAQLDQVIEDSISNPLGQTLVKSLVSVNHLNKIFDNTISPFPQGYTQDQCDGCPPPQSCLYEFVSPIGDGTGIGTGSLIVDGNSRVLSSSMGSNGLHYIEFNAAEVCNCGALVSQLEVVSVSLVAGEGAGYQIREGLANCSENVIITSGGSTSPIPLGTYDCTFFSQVGTQAFTVTVIMS